MSPINRRQSGSSDSTDAPTQRQHAILYTLVEWGNWGIVRILRGGSLSWI